MTKDSPAQEIAEEKSNNGKPDTHSAKENSVEHGNVVINMKKGY